MRRKEKNKEVSMTWKSPYVVRAKCTLLVAKYWAKSLSKYTVECAKCTPLLAKSWASPRSTCKMCPACLPNDQLCQSLWSI
jgi:hypothetical protein